MIAAGEREVVFGKCAFNQSFESLLPAWAHTSHGSGCAAEHVAAETFGAWSISAARLCSILRAAAFTECRAR